ncbi:alpha/beta fold hydrolase [Pseudomonas sp. nanlin1]|uniref:alpha/beta fold hydrolase n=1 Tax=Pseudomonas sp. nanlin1 TaxID=3040605 RepID=UPI00388D230F
MRDQLVLLPGWGLGVGPLEPLAAALRALDPQLEVVLEPLPSGLGADLQGWLDALDARLPAHAWLAGWSLGGMLAAELAGRRGEGCRGLIGLASNLCFVAREDWAAAMPAADFSAFAESCRANPQATLQRFGLLCAQGAATGRALARQLNALAPASTGAELSASLQLLAQLDTRQALQAFKGPQLHLFAAQDALVPSAAAEQLARLMPERHISLIEQASHAFVLEDPQGVAAAIQAFMHERTDD